MPHPIIAQPKSDEPAGRVPKGDVPHAECFRRRLLTAPRPTLDFAKG